MATILRIVADHFGVSVTDLQGERRNRRVTWPRQIAMYLAREMAGASSPAIGRMLGGRDHTTVLYGCRYVASRISRRQDIAAEVEALRSVIAAHDHADDGDDQFAEELRAIRNSLAVTVTRAETLMHAIEAILAERERSRT